MIYRASFLSSLAALVVLGSLVGVPEIASGQSASSVKSLSARARLLLKRKDLPGARLAIREACFLRPDDVTLRRQLRALEVRLAKQHYSEAKKALSDGLTDLAVEKLLSSYTLAPTRAVSARLSKLGYRLHLGYWRTPEEITEFTEADALAEAEARTRLRLKSDFRVFRTAHFRVFTNIPKGRREDKWMQPTLKVLESTRESFFWLLAGDVNAEASRDGFDIVIFNKEQDYRDHVDLRFAFNTAGHYCHQTHAAFFYRIRSYPALWKILIHETVHLLSDRVLRGAYPPWISEGIAAYFEAAVVQKDHSLLIGRPHPKRLAQLRSTGLVYGNYIPAQQLFQARSMSEFSQGARVKQAHAQSWGWAYFLLHNDAEKRDILLQCLRQEREAVDRQGCGKNTHSVWIRTLSKNGLPLNRLDMQFKRFIRSIRFDGK